MQYVQVIAIITCIWKMICVGTWYRHLPFFMRDDDDFPVLKRINFSVHRTKWNAQRGLALTSFRLRICFLGNEISTKCDMRLFGFHSIVVRNASAYPSSVRPYIFFLLFMPKTSKICCPVEAGAIIKFPLSHTFASDGTPQSHWLRPAPTTERARNGRRTRWLVKFH